MSVVAAIKRRKIVAILRGPIPRLAESVAERLFAAGVTMLEVTLNTPQALASIAAIREFAPADAYVGVGTVLSAADAAAAATAGAQFLVTPAVTPAVAAGVALGLPTLAGAYTATEAVTATSLGAAMVKLFPAAIGGPAYLRALLDPLDHLDFLVVGGIGLPQLQPFHEAGAAGFGIGGPLIGDAMRGGDLRQLDRRARDFVQAVAELT